MRSVGILFYAFGGVLCFLPIFLFAAYLLGKVVKELEVEPRILLLGVVLFLPFATLMLFVGRGMRKLQAWARWATIVLASIGLLQFPLGTVIAGYILYLMLARQGKRIFEDDYKSIIAATPQLKYRTSLIVWIALGLLFLAPLAVLIKATMEAMH